MKRKLLSMLLMAVAVMGAKAQLLYKISGNGLEKPSYVVGTHHLASAAFAEKITGIRDAINNTEQVYGEVDTEKMTAPEQLQKVQAAMMLPDGLTLDKVLTADQMKKLNAFMKEMLGADLSNPMVAAQMGKMSPQALVNQFTVLLYMQKHMGEFDPTSLIDGYFQQVAKKNNEPVGGLETVDFQIETLFKNVPMERQVEQLMCLIDNREFTANMLDKITEAYYAQNMAGIKAAIDEKIGNSCDSTPEEDARLIYSRNQNWVKQMPEIMTAKPTLFVVGAAHIPGEHGLITLLVNAGYTVEGIK